MLPAETATSETANAEDQAIIDQLLGNDSEVQESPAPAVESEEPAEETPATETEESSEAEAAEETAEEAADEAEQAEETAEEAEEESELVLTETDRDYSEAAYKKAAEHYSRTHKVQLDPNDPAHRALLKENMDRGRALADLKAAQKTEETEADEAKVPSEVTQPQQLTEAQIQQSLTNVQELAKQRNVPQVSKYVADTFVKALWPDRNIKLTQEHANNITNALHAFFLMALDDAAPAMLGMVDNNLGQDPVWGSLRTKAIDTSAFEHLSKTLKGERFTDISRMEKDGTLQQVIANNPNVFRGITAGDGKNPIKNRAAVLEAAYKFARGEKTLDQVSKAVKTGENKAKDTAKKIAASRVAPGTPKGGFSKPVSDGQSLINEITQGDGSASKFAALTKKHLQPAGSFHR